MYSKIIATVLLLLTVAPAALACTGVIVAQGGSVIVGGNEDWTRFDSYVWAEAATEEVYGAVYLGYEIRGEFGPRGRHWFEFQGVNSQGLYFDTFGAPTLANPAWEGKPPCQEHIEILMMQGCSTVEDAVSLLNAYDLSQYRQYNETVFRSNMQFFLADSTGTAAVVDGEHVHWMENGYMVTTNFRLSNPSLGGWPCFRYDVATRMLEEDATATIRRVAEILDATQFPCAQGYASCTRYSAVCDLANDVLALYFNGDFSRFAELDITRLCDEGLDRVSIESLVAEAAVSESGSPTDTADSETADIAFVLQQTIQGGWVIGDTALQDFDGDGDPDLLCVCRSGGSFLLWNNGEGGFSEPDRTDELGSFAFAAVDDFDSDGAPDALVGDFAGAYEIWLNDGIGGLAGHALPRRSGAASLGSGDLDGDGDLDVFVGTGGAANFLWINDGTGQFASVGLPASADTVNGVNIADLDGDGDLDVVLGRYSVSNVIYMNDGTGSFAVHTGALGDTHSTIGLASGDFDLDGDADLFIGAHDGADSVWLNDGLGQFRDSGQRLSTGWSYQALAADIDADLDLDIIVAGGNFPDSIWLNDGEGHFTQSTARFIGDQGASVNVGDLDGDGDLDIVFAHDPGMSNESKIYVWLNVAED